MMRIRAHIASGLALIAPGYTSWLSEKERALREKHLFRSSGRIPEAVGKGYEPSQGSIVLTTHLPRKFYGLLYGV